MKNRCLYLLYGSMILIISSCRKEIDNPITAPLESASVTSYLNNTGFSQIQERPFKGQIVGSFISTPTSTPAIYNSIANSKGNVTHLGVFNKVTSDMINIASSTVEGTFIMTSAGGEQITGTYNGTFSFGTIPGTFSWVLNATITGGSERFSHATGEFVFLANGNYVIIDGVVNGNYTETFDGAIIY